MEFKMCVQAALTVVWKLIRRMGSLLESSSCTASCMFCYRRVEVGFIEFSAIDAVYGALDLADIFGTKRIEKEF